MKNFDLRWFDNAALCVVMAANGYPGRPETGTAIRGLDRAAAIKDVAVFHAGTKSNAEGEVTAAGGRVLAVSASAKDVAAAQALAYRAVDAIDWPGGFYRRDIGWRAIARNR